MYKKLIALGLVFLLCSACFAFDKSELSSVKIKDKNDVEWVNVEKQAVTKDGKAVGEKLADKYSTYTKEKFTTTLNPQGYYEKISKPNIAEDKLLTAEESKQVKMALWNEGLADDKNKVLKEGRKLIFTELMPAKNDYKHDFDRGTVFYTDKNRNYSYSKVIIPDGTVVRNCNFTQRKPYTQAIQGKNLQLIDCNLTNNTVDPTWIINGKQGIAEVTQIDRTIKSKVVDGDKTHLIISHKVKEDKPNGEFVEVNEDEEIVLNSELSNKLLYFAE